MYNAITYVKHSPNKILLIVTVPLNEINVNNC